MTSGNHIICLNQFYWTVQETEYKILSTKTEQSKCLHGDLIYMKKDNNRTDSQSNPVFLEFILCSQQAFEQYLGAGILFPITSSWVCIFRARAAVWNLLYTLKHFVSRKYIWSLLCQTISLVNLFFSSSSQGSDELRLFCPHDAIYYRSCIGCS